jgi:hypothetical protein
VYRHTSQIPARFEGHRSSRDAFQDCPLEGVDKVIDQIFAWVSVMRRLKSLLASASQIQASETVRFRS